MNQELDFQLDYYTNLLGELQDQLDVVKDPIKKGVLEMRISDHRKFLAALKAIQGKTKGF